MVALMVALAQRQLPQPQIEAGAAEALVTETLQAGREAVGWLLFATSALPWQRAARLRKWAATPFIRSLLMVILYFS